MRLIHGDCLEVMPTLEAGSVDAIITDLPYGTTACKWDVIIPFAPMWAEVKRLLKPRGAFVTTASQPFTSALVMSNPGWFKYEWIWDKKKGGNPLLSKIQPIKVTENIVVFSENTANYYPQMTPRDKPKSRGKNRGVKSQTTNNAFTDNKVYVDYYPKNIIEISNASQKNKLHPTQKPVALLEYLILTYTNPGALVLDICAGSGTTGVACVKTGRDFIGIEKDAGYFEIMQRRIAEAQQQMVLPGVTT